MCLNIFISRHLLFRTLICHQLFQNYVYSGFSFSNRVGVEKIEIQCRRRNQQKILEKRKDCFAVETKVAGEGHVHRWRKSPVTCRKGKPWY